MKIKRQTLPRNFIIMDPLLNRCIYCIRKNIFFHMKKASIMNRNKSWLNFHFFHPYCGTYQYGFYIAFLQIIFMVAWKRLGLSRIQS